MNPPNKQKKKEKKRKANPRKAGAIHCQDHPKPIVWLVRCRLELAVPVILSKVVSYVCCLVAITMLVLHSRRLGRLGTASPARAMSAVPGFTTVIGLEVHAQLQQPETKLFSRAPGAIAGRGLGPNEAVRTSFCSLALAAVRGV